MRRVYPKYRKLRSRLSVCSLFLGLTQCNAQFAQPKCLWLMLLVLPLVCLLYFARRGQKRRLDAFVAPRLQARLTLGQEHLYRRQKLSIWFCAFVLLGITLAQPQYGFVWEDVHHRGIDIVIALDVSESMLVHDGENKTTLSRLSLAKRKVTDLLQMLEGDRIALVAFAGTAFVECPLTLDYAAARLFLDDFDTNLIPVRGTALDTAINTSIQVLSNSGQNAKAIILITDGEDHTQRAVDAAKIAAQQGILIYPIGIGRAEGAPIPLAEGGFLHDPDGNLVLSRLDDVTLKRIAHETGGQYTHSMTGDVDLHLIYQDGIRKKLDTQDLGVRRKQHWQHRYQWPLLVAWILLMLESLWPIHWSKRKHVAVESSHV